MNKKELVFVSVFIVIIVLISITMFFVGSKNFKKNSSVDNKEVNTFCHLIKTYTVKDISSSDSGLYITVGEYQTEGVSNVTISKELGSFIKKGNNYEFYIDINKKYVNSNNDVILKNGKITNIIYTDKRGMDTVSKYEC